MFAQTFSFPYNQHCIDQVPAAGVDAADQVEVWLVDDERAEQNPHLAFVLNDAVEVMADLRAEGRSILLHCVQAQSRTPTVAALYGARRAGTTAEDSLARIQQVLPGAAPNVAFQGALVPAEVAAIAPDAAIATDPVPAHQGALAGEPRDPRNGYDLTLIWRSTGGSGGPRRVTGAVMKFESEPSYWIPGYVDTAFATDDTDSLLRYLEEKSGGNGITYDSLWYWINSPDDAPALIAYYDRQLASNGSLDTSMAAAKEVEPSPPLANVPTAGDSSPDNLSLEDEAITAEDAARTGPGLRIRRVDVPPWNVDAGEVHAEWNELGGQPMWHFATPWVFRALAAPSTYQPILAAPGRNASQEHRCAYWTSLFYLLLYRLGWADPAAGLDWWQASGYPVEDETLRLIWEVWGRDERLPLAQAWLHHRARPFRSDFEQRCGYRPRLRADRSWPNDPGELSGLGPAQLHLEDGGGRNHLTTAFEGGASTGTLIRSRATDRRAVLITDSMIGWYGALIEHGDGLPSLGDRSWRVDVIAKPVGFLGTYRRSRETGIWFTGQHSIHRAGT